MIIKKLIGIFLITIIVLFMCGFYYLGSDGKSSLIYSGVSSPHILSSSSDGENTQLVISDTKTSYYLLGNNGEIIEKIDFEDFALSAFIRGNSLYLYSDINNKILVNEYSLDNFERLTSYYLPINIGEIELLNCDLQGNSYVKPISSNQILVYDNFGGELQPLNFASEVVFMDCFDDYLYLASTDQFIIVNTVDLTENILSLGYLPQFMLTNQLILDSDGNIHSFDSMTTIIKDSGIITDISSTIFWTGTKICSDENGYIYMIKYDSQNYRVEKYNSIGTLNTVFNLDGTPLSVNSNGIIQLIYDAIYFTPYNSFNLNRVETDPDITPPDLDIRDGKYIILEPGLTISALKKQCDNQGTITFDGKELTSGIIRTGMIFDLGGINYIICVKGDLNSTGTVNSADLKILMQLIASNQETSKEILYAGDLSDNYILDTLDIVLLKKNNP